jgi:mono/diheme cytochrome c family protein
MLKNLSLTILAFITVTGVCTGATARPDQSNSTVVAPTLRTSPANGARMYGAYCASCHGTNGKGDGPSAAALRIPPVDLTVLSKNNGGKFPANHVATVLRFGPKIPSHSMPEMPAWEPVFGKMDVAGNHDTQLRISNLSRYLEAIQEK